MLLKSTLKSSTAPAKSESSAAAAAEDDADAARAGLRKVEPADKPAPKVRRSVPISCYCVQLCMFF